MVTGSVSDFITRPALSAGATDTFKLKQQRRRLESVICHLTVTVTGTPSSLRTESYARILRNFTLKVNDAVGRRDAVNAEGVALIEMWESMGGGLDFDSLRAIGNTGTLATFTIVYPVFIRHPLMEDPAGNLLSIPLYEVREDPEISYTIAGLADIAGTGITALSVVPRFRIQYRDVAGGGYVPTETISSGPTQLTGSSKVELEIPQNGFLTGLLLQGYSDAGNTRAAFLSGTDPDVSIYFGREQKRRTNISIESCYAALTTNQLPLSSGSAFLTDNVLADSNVWFDFLDDSPLIGAYTPQSTLNLSSLIAGGDTARVAFNLTSASCYVRMTWNKILGGADATRLLGI